MDYAAIFALILKGLAVVESAIQAEQEAEPAIKAIIALTTGAQAGTVTDADLAQTEDLLDQMLTDFNTPLT